MIATHVRTDFGLHGYDGYDIVLTIGRYYQINGVKTLAYTEDVDNSSCYSSLRRDLKALLLSDFGLLLHPVGGIQHFCKLINEVPS